MFICNIGETKISHKEAAPKNHFDLFYSLFIFLLKLINFIMLQFGCPGHLHPERHPAISPNIIHHERVYREIRNWRPPVINNKTQRTN